MRRAHRPPRALDHPRRQQDVGVHLDRGPGDLTVPLSVVQVADHQPAAVDVAGEVDRHADSEIADIHVAAMLPRWNRAKALVLLTSLWPADRSWRRVKSVGEEDGTLLGRQCRFSRQYLRVLVGTRQHRYDSGKAPIRDTHPGDSVRTRRYPVEPPDHPQRTLHLVGHEADAGDEGEAERAGVDVEERDRQGVSRSRSFDVDRAREGVHRAEQRVSRSRVVVRARGVELEVAGIASLEQNHLPRPGSRRHRDLGVQPIDALGILRAVASLTSHYQHLV